MVDETTPVETVSTPVDVVVDTPTDILEPYPYPTGSLDASPEW